MAASDAKPYPQKGVAYRVTFPILDADGDLVTGASTPDSEVSKDGGAFADCTNEATEIATNSGMYYLDLTATEMAADTVAVIVKTGTAGAKTTPLVLYPDGRFAAANAAIIPGTSDNTAFTGTTTIFESDDITEATADHFNGRTILFTAGALLGQSTVIEDYALNGGRGRFTVTALTEAVPDNSTFVIV
jgi:hypothetical protein